MDITAALKSEIASYDDTEWSGTLGDHQLTFYARPITPADMTVISRKHPDFAQSPSLEGMVDMLIHKVVGENGSKVFQKKHKPFLMRVGTNKIGEIFGDLFSSQLEEYTDEDLDEDVKN